MIMRLEKMHSTERFCCLLRYGSDTQLIFSLFISPFICLLFGGGKVKMVQCTHARVHTCMALNVFRLRLRLRHILFDP